ncbi:nose resistant to fluoxetine protein 6-like [Elysia marginata]|uniref:Nose resistant to fluoxetine protein 6-like n=1 Tax=Elysia marginata TaxID=1093978 RepID=A0AAV4EHT9_9GAST|nr:nose resistant to fluoxetine protein 6-like [Elysia marginata]
MSATAQNMSSTPQEKSSPSGDSSSVSDDRAAADFKRMLQLLQRAGGFLPEIRDAVMRRQPITQKQTKELFDFARQFGNTIASLPESLQGVNSTLDVLKLLADSGLLQSFINASSLAPAPGSPQPHTVHWLKCQADLLATATALGSGQMWALQMLDSWGKPESGILRGNMMFTGNNAECTKVHYTNTATFADIRGRTCRASIFLETLQNPMITLVCTADLDIGDDPWAIVAVIILSTFLALMVAGTLTEFCVTTETRPRRDFINAFISNNSNMDLLNSGINGLTSNGGMGKPHGYTNGVYEMSEVAYITPGTDAKIIPSANGNMNDTAKEEVFDGVAGQHETKLGEDNAEKTPRVLNGDYTDDLSSYYPHSKVRKSNGYLSDPYTRSSHITESMNRSTFIRAAHETNQPGSQLKTDDSAHLPKWQRCLLAFSLPRNAGKILGVKGAPGSISCLHGIRVLSMGWVIFGHALSFSGQGAFFQNKLDMFELLRGFTFQIMANGTLSVDSFFFMSGLLTAYMFLKECGKKGKVTVKQGILYYVHRYWRLTPPLMIWILVVACLVQYVGEGRPGWIDYVGAQLCRDSWWVNMLYIQNLYDDKAGCIGVTWYLANDMQFYFLAPLVVIPWIYRKQIFGFVMASLLIIMHLVANAWLVYEYNFDVFRQGEGYMQKLYVKPWARVGPFAIGLITGYILWKTKCKMHINKYIVAIGWFFSMAAMLTVTLVTYDENKDPIGDPDGWPVGGKMAHETLSRPVWALVLSWIVLACATGYGGFINSILSWEGWLPLSRLTYCAYLVHLTLMGFEFSSLTTSTLYTMTNLIYLFFGMYVMSYAVAFLLAVGVEAPMLGLEKVMLSR